MVRCFVNNVSSTRYPFPLSLLRDVNWTRPFRGNNSSEGTFMRAGARLLSSPFLPLRDFFRVASPLPRRFARTHALKNVLSRRSFPPPRFADEKRSSSIYFIPSPFLFHGFVWRPPLSRTSLDSRESFLFNKLEWDWIARVQNNVEYIICQFCLDGFVLLMLNYCSWRKNGF